MTSCERSPSAGALTVQDTGDAVTMEARILDAPIGDRALEAVKSGRMAGLSIEFRAERETVQGRSPDCGASAAHRHRIGRAPGIQHERRGQKSRHRRALEVLPVKLWPWRQKPETTLI